MMEGTKVMTVIGAAPAGLWAGLPAGDCDGAGGAGLAGTSGIGLGSGATFPGAGVTAPGYGVTNPGIGVTRPGMGLF